MSEFAFDTELDHLITASDVARRNQPLLTIDDDLENALKLMRDSGDDYIPVVENHKTMKFLGCVRQVRIMSAYNRALIENRREQLIP